MRTKGLRRLNLNTQGALIVIARHILTFTLQGTRPHRK